MVKPAEPAAVSDGRLLRGRRTKALILSRAIDVASAEGLDSLSLARLGTDLSISKSGVKGHFISRTDLQLAVIAVAAELYTTRVVTPALKVADGLPRLQCLCERWIDFMQSGELTGRSFFLTALVEYDARPGPIHDELLRLRLRWEGIFTSALDAAGTLGHIRPIADPAQVFFEIASLIAGATLDAQLRDDAEVFGRARTAVLARLRTLSSHDGLLPI